MGKGAADYYCCISYLMAGRSCYWCAEVFDYGLPTFILLNRGRWQRKNPCRRQRKFIIRILWEADMVRIVAAFFWLFFNFQQLLAPAQALALLLFVELKSLAWGRYFLEFFKWKSRICKKICEQCGKPFCPSNGREEISPGVNGLVKNVGRRRALAPIIITDLKKIQRNSRIFVQFLSFEELII